MFPTASVQVEKRTKLFASRNKNYNYKLGENTLYSGHDRKQEKRVKERMSQSHQTKAPSHYVDQISQQQQMDSGKNYVTTQEENAYQKYHPKHFASSMTQPDVCEFSEVLAN